MDDNNEWIDCILKKIYSLLLPWLPSEQGIRALSPAFVFGHCMFLLTTESQKSIPVFRSGSTVSPSPSFTGKIGGTTAVIGRFVVVGILLLVVEVVVVLGVVRTKAVRHYTKFELRKDPVTSLMSIERIKHMLGNTVPRAPIILRLIIISEASRHVFFEY